MSRSLVVLIIIVIIIVAGLFWLAGRDTVQQPHQIEQTIPLANLQNAATPQ